ncbi:MAG: chromosome partitioning protein [Herbaspirillum sp.]|nr:chromosome partitioning protein [Herbaspirillum sp.]|tara:strand:- start:281 stop:2080 length:1800 start_codon:yes stop_codon:yes gene_type:complete
MRIASLAITNFRGIRSGHILFREHTVLVGANNTGKSTVIEALTLLFGRDKLIRELTEHDFYGSSPAPADRIKLVATITDFEQNVPERNTDWFREGRGVPKWFDETTGKVSAVPTDACTKLCCQIAVQAFFDREALAVEMVRYFHDHDHDHDNDIDPFSLDTPVIFPSKLIQHFGYFLVRANRSWDRVMSWGSELFRRAINVAAAQPSEAILAERDRLRAPENPIERDPQIEALVDNVNTELSKFIERSPTLKLRLTNTDSRSVLESVSAHFAVGKGSSVPASRQGSGLISLQGLMLLLELGRARAQAGQGFIMALEEPEIHIPPSSQQQLVHRVQALSTQTFVTTHSPTVAALADPTSVLLLRNENGSLVAEPFLEAPLPREAQAWERRFFQQSRVEVMSSLMYPHVLVPEGRADYFILRTVLRAVVMGGGWHAEMEHAFGLDIGIVPTEDAKVTETYSKLSRLHGAVCCLVDGDAAGTGYIKTLNRMKAPPRAIIQWNPGALIEDVVGWMLEVVDQDGMTELAGITEPAAENVAAVVEYLKSKKMDIVAYELVADVISRQGASLERAKELFGGMAGACKGQDSQRFKQVEKNVWIFQK